MNNDLKNLIKEICLIKYKSKVDLLILLTKPAIASN